MVSPVIQSVGMPAQGVQTVPSASKMTSTSSIVHGLPSSQALTSVGSSSQSTGSPAQGTQTELLQARMVSTSFTVDATPSSQARCIVAPGVSQVGPCPAQGRQTCVGSACSTISKSAVVQELPSSQSRNSVWSESQSNTRPIQGSQMLPSQSSTVSISKKVVGSPSSQACTVTGPVSQSCTSPAQGTHTAPLQSTVSSSLTVQAMPSSQGNTSVWVQLARQSSGHSMVAVQPGRRLTSLEEKKINRQPVASVDR